MKKPPPMLTSRIIADLRSGDECCARDADYPGLRVRRTNAARVVFCRFRASDGALREIKLGEFGPMTLAEARRALGRLKLERERGVDPHLQKQQVRTQARRKREAEKLASYAVENMVEGFIDEKLSKQKTGAEGARLSRHDLLPRLGDRAAAGLTRRELQEEVIRPMLKRAPRGGTHLLSRIRCAYAHAAEQGRIPNDFLFPRQWANSSRARKRSGSRNTKRARNARMSRGPTLLRWRGRFMYSLVRILNVRQHILCISADSGFWWRESSTGDDAVSSADPSFPRPRQLGSEFPIGWLRAEVMQRASFPAAGGIERARCR
jgi:hypothetical protein